MKTELSTLLIAAQHGDHDAFAEVVRRFQSWAIAEATRLVGDPHLAQDVAQEAFIDAYLHLGQLRQPDAFPGWLRRILIKHADRHTRRKRPPTLPEEMALAQPANGPDPAGEALLSEVRQLVQGAVADLPENQRQVAAFFYFGGYAQKEIAEALAVPVSTIKKRLHDARNGLKRRIPSMTEQTKPQLTAQKEADEQFRQKVQYFVALKTGDLSLIKKLLAANPGLAHTRTEWPVGAEGHFWPLNATGLHWAACTDDLALLTLLLERGAEIDAASGDDMTPLHYAVMMQNGRAVQALLNAGADVNRAKANGMTALHLAALKSTPDMIQLLAERGAQLNAQDSGGLTATDWAARTGRADALDLLTRLGASPTDMPLAKPYKVQPQPTSQRTVPVGDALLGRIIDPDGQPADGRELAAPNATLYRPASQAGAPFLETGIKIIDLLCPLVRGGHNGLYTPLAGVGRKVVAYQIIESVASLHDGRVVYLGLENGPMTAQGLMLAWRGEFGIANETLDRRIAVVFGQADDPDERKRRQVETGLTIAEEFRRAGHEVLLVIESKLALVDGVVPYLRANVAATPDAAITVLYEGDHSAGAEPPALANLDAVITFTRARAAQKLWPAVDPLASHSTLLSHPLLDAQHRNTATEARRVLARYDGLHGQVERHGTDALFYLDDPTGDERTVLRARRLQRWLTQPFPGLETFTGTVGAYVPRQETLAISQAILEGVYDTVPEDVFYFRTTLENVAGGAQGPAQD